MSEHQERVVRRIFDDVFNKGDLGLIDELLTTDHVNNDPVNVSER